MGKLLIIIFFVVIAAIYCGGAQGDCPNTEFVSKHICNNCGDATKAASFAKKVDNERRIVSSTHSVFYGVLSTQYEQRDSYCRFTRPARKFECIPNFKREWTCTSKGSQTAWHEKSSGYYDSRKDNNW